ncbi:hypothetical protein HNP46_006507 [Pseudomonas nitritireducens]|uniref:Uncharacterized protein n=1 Tax=Pseudomonas nitroreducens TaxID=46680 RepID=A0A7W7P416_PSENT|nr:hypothetical protein [Pseudomonas nitritireducens]MBB4867593.1 hypothetical protein [Pseudomonas nitritireducens]
MPQSSTAQAAPAGLHFLAGKTDLDLLREMAGAPVHVRLRDGLELVLRGENFMDLEASGLLNGSFPIEVGVSSDGYEYESLIAPQPDWKLWDKAAEAIHGRARHELILHGVPCKGIVHDLNGMYEGKLIWVSSSHDIAWLQMIYSASEAEPTFGVAKVYDFIPVPLWQILKNRLPEPDRHTALRDARALRAGIDGLRSYVEARNLKTE